MFCFELCKVSNGNVSIIKPCAHPTNLEYLVANSWCLQKPYPAKPWASSESQRQSVGSGNTAAKVFQERVREPLGYYSSRTSSTTHSNACLWLGSKNIFLPQSEASIYSAAFVVFLYEISSIGALFFLICLANMLNYGISLILGARFHWNSSRRTLSCTTQTGSANRRVAVKPLHIRRLRKQRDRCWPPIGHKK